MVLATVLIADDHAVMADAVRSTVSGIYDVVAMVADGLALVEAAVRLCPDVLIVDIGMPGISGIEAVRRLRSAGCDSAIVILTVHEDPEVRADAIQAGADAYIVKNRMVTELAPAIAASVANRQ